MCEVVFVVAISGRRHLYLFHSWQRLSLRGRNQRIISRYGNPQHFMPAKSQHSVDLMVRPARLERAASWFVARESFKINDLGQA